MKKQKVTILKIGYYSDPVGRELDAFYHKSKGKQLDEEFKIAAIKGLVLNRDWTSDKIKINGKEFIIFVEFIRQRAAANDRAFFKSLGRALEEKPKYGNVEIENFLFKYWDVTAPNGALGLKHFTDQAVVELLEIKFGDRAPSLAAYRAIRKSAFPSPERPPKIREVTLERDGSVLARPLRRK